MFRHMHWKAPVSTYFLSNDMSWRRIRREVLERDGWIYAECQSPIKGRNAHAHHKLPRGLGGLDTLENLISLCSGCHSLKHMNLQASLGRRLIERIAVRVARQVINVMPKNLSTAASLSSEPTIQKSSTSDRRLEKERTDIFLFVIILILVLFFLSKPILNYL